MTTLEPRDHREAVAHFRAHLIGDLAHAELSHGELLQELRAISKKRYRPPGALASRRFGVSTLERWLYRYKKGGLAALMPARRSDRGRGQALTDAQRALILDIRREHRSASANLILETLVEIGLLDEGVVTPTTLRRLFAQHDLPRVSKRRAIAATTQRLRWQAAQPNALWHGDVCHLTGIEISGRKQPVRIHALMDDCSRYIVGIEAHHHEREVDMLGLFVRALRRHGKPEAMYLDNGSTYRGETLEVACRRLELSLLHAAPYSPESRGKMERFWRTLREGCLDFIGKKASLHDINVRLWAFVDERYHRRPHAGLFGRTPGQVFHEGGTAPVSEAKLREALTVRARRRIRKDSTVSVAGQDFQVAQAFLAKKTVSVAYCAFDEPIVPVVEHEERTYPLERVDPVANGRRARAEFPSPDTLETGFDPNAALLERARRHIRQEENDR